MPARVVKEERKGIRCFRYDDIWRTILNTKSNKNIYFGGFIDYDDTPRHGKKGSVILGATPEKFGNYITKLLAKNSSNDKEFTFLNAWNEWGEGMYLEPDEKWGENYLAQIKLAKERYEFEKKHF